MDTPEPNPDHEPNDVDLEVREHMGQLISCDLIPRLTNPRLVWFTAQMGAATVAVVLDPNVAALFTTSEAVNTLLGSESRRMRSGLAI
jgi:hypothetical protein